MWDVILLALMHENFFSETQKEKEIRLRNAINTDGVRFSWQRAGCDAV